MSQRYTLIPVFSSPDLSTRSDAHTAKCHVLFKIRDYAQIQVSPFSTGSDVDQCDYSHSGTSATRFSTVIRQSNVCLYIHIFDNDTFSP